MIKQLFAGIFILSTLTITADKVHGNRLSKKDKQDLLAMFTQFIDGMERQEDISVKEQIESRWWFWETPMVRIERSIDQLNQMAQQIQNYILDLNVTQQNDNGVKECCKEALARLEHLEMLLAKLIVILLAEKETIGNLDDESVGEQDFNCVEDIDNAELSLVSWMKTIYREQLKDKFIS